MRQIANRQRAKIRASTLNSVLDAVEDFKSRQTDGGAAVNLASVGKGIITIRNDTGVDLAQFSVVGIDVIVSTPGSADDHTTYLLSGITPIAGYEKKFAIVQQAVPNGQCGYAMIVGVTPCRISRPVGDTSTTAGMVAGQTYLQTGLTGAQIIWEDPAYSSTDVHNALVAVPTAGSSSPAQIVVVDRVATANIALAGSVSVDGSVPATGKLVLASAQTPGAGAADRGIWVVNTAASWTKSSPFQPTEVFVANGSALSGSTWFLSGVNTWKQAGSFFG